jgi:DNA replication protein DnaC
MLGYALERSRLPARYHEATFENAKRTSHNREAYDKAFAYCDLFTFIPNPTGAYMLPDKRHGNKATVPEKSLFITGEAGEGKTYLAGACCNLLLQKKIGVTFGNVISLLGRIKDTYKNDSGESEEQAIDKLTDVDLLILDDLGKEKVTQWTEQMLYYVINNRYENLKPMIITSNFSLTDLKKRYEVGPYIVSRLVEICDGLRMVGDNWRKR